MTARATVGRILHYVLTADDVGEAPQRIGSSRPAIVVSVFEPSVQGLHGLEHLEPLYSVQVFMDAPPPASLLWKSNLRITDAPTSGQLHWPPMTR